MTIPIVGPWNWPALRVWLAARAIDGVEVVGADRYSRTALIGTVPVVVQVVTRPDSVVVRVTSSAPVDVRDVATRVTRVFDLERDMETMRTQLGHDPWLAGLLGKHAGLRVPGGWDPFELAVRAVLGQQVTVVAARHLASQVVALCGTPLPIALRTTGLAAMFPTPAQMAAADLGVIGMPEARRATLMALARAVVDDERFLVSGTALDETIARLRVVKGIGEWTAHYIALRALRHPDAFPSSDIGLLRGAARETGTRPTPVELQRRAEAWRPCRAYAAQLLWAEDGET